MDGQPNFPDDFVGILKDIAKLKNLKFFCYEYWGVPIISLSCIEGSKKYEIIFDYQEDSAGIQIYSQLTGGRYSFYHWCWKYIPMFPVLVKKMFIANSSVSLNASKEEILKKIEKISSLN